MHSKSRSFKKTTLIACLALVSYPTLIPPAHCRAQQFPFRFKCRLVDYIDATTDSTHNFRDDGASRILQLPTGRFRVTAAAMGFDLSWFAYDIKTADKAGVPHLLVAELSNDAERFFSKWEPPFGSNPTRYREFHEQDFLAQWYRTPAGSAMEVYHNYWEEPYHPATPTNSRRMVQRQNRHNKRHPRTRFDHRHSRQTARRRQLADRCSKRQNNAGLGYIQDRS